MKIALLGLVSGYVFIRCIMWISDHFNRKSLKDIERSSEALRTESCADLDEYRKLNNKLNKIEKRMTAFGTRDLSLHDFIRINGLKKEIQASIASIYGR